MLSNCLPVQMSTTLAKKIKAFHSITNRKTYGYEAKILPNWKVAFSIFELNANCRNKHPHEMIILFKIFYEFTEIGICTSYSSYLLQL